MKISILLPYKENFSPLYPGAVSIFLNAVSKKSKYRKSITVYGRTVAIIGEPNQLRLAVDAIASLSNGSMHGPVYTKLESARRREKADRAKIWEDQDVF